MIENEYYTEDAENWRAVGVDMPADQDLGERV